MRQKYWGRDNLIDRSKTSSTTGQLARTGKPAVIVSRESANRNLCTTDRSRRLHIDEDHSSMIKFGRGNAQIPIMIDRIQDICKVNTATLQDSQPSDFYSEVCVANPAMAEGIMHQI